MFGLLRAHSGACKKQDGFMMLFRGQPFTTKSLTCEQQSIEPPKHPVVKLASAETPMEAQKGNNRKTWSFLKNKNMIRQRQTTPTALSVLYTGLPNQSNDALNF
eukprot:1156186-Pelagomonas_calceolata.AAC.3